MGQFCLWKDKEMRSRALVAERDLEDAVEGAKRGAVVLPSLCPSSCGIGQHQRALLTSSHFQRDPDSTSGALSPSCHFLSFFFKGNSAAGGENEQAANERAAAALCQACKTLLGAQLDAVGGWTPFIFTLELFSSHPVCSVLFISESVDALSDGHGCRMQAQTFPEQANFRTETD